jgi:hypothetical protein
MPSQPEDLMNGAGPFAVSGEQIERLGERFTMFVNALLDAEGRSGDLVGYALRTHSRDNTADGGVDAHVESAVGTPWIPAGESAWQFKRSDLAPAECKAELRGARWARDLVTRGATYFLVLGARLGAERIEARRVALAEEAADLALGVGEESFVVIDGDMLARWATEFPSLAISSALVGRELAIVEFDLWSRSNRHLDQWVSSASRDAAIELLRRSLVDDGPPDVRVFGPSGNGKTRMVMEALRGEWAPLVAYIAEADRASDVPFNVLLRTERPVILVIDECDDRRHEKLAEQIPAGSPLRLITIGGLQEHQLRSPIVEVGALEDDGLQGFLGTNYPGLWPEARRFIVEISTGNVRTAQILADRILRAGAAHAAELIQAADLAELVADLLPEGRPFFLSTILALVERVGWDRELRGQLETLAAFAGATPEELDQVGRDLEERGLLTRQGRYRLVAPHPVAVVLAARAWQDMAGRIVDELLPELDTEMALGLMTRAAHLGSYEPARRELRRLMQPDGPLGSLASIEERNLGRFLTQLAIVAPDETTRHIARLLEAEPTEVLEGATGSRRDLVWTIEKLAWHSSSFELAADSLVRLALAENEAYSNNATGVWISLFGTLLPATAASPDQRRAYLLARAQNPDDRVRELVVKACERGLNFHESVSVSGELQGGVLVEPRGTARTHAERGEYQRGLIELLGHLVGDESAVVSARAVGVLVGAVHPWIDDAEVGGALADALIALDDEAQRNVRRTIEYIRGLLERHPNPLLLQAIDALDERLPAASALEQLRILLDTATWLLDDDEPKARLRALLTEVAETNHLDSVLCWLRETEINGAWQLGQALHDLDADQTDVYRALVESAATNLGAIAGYLTAQAERGDEEAFDRLLDGEAAVAMGAVENLALTVRGPTTERAMRRVIRLVGDIPVAQAARASFSWPRRISDDEASEVLDVLMARVAAQEDYDAVVDWASLAIYDTPVSDRMRAQLFALVMLVQQYPDVGRQRWDWSRIAARAAADHPVEVASAIFDRINQGLLTLDSDPEAAALCDATRLAPGEIWADLAHRLEQEGWRLAMVLRGWFLNCVPIDVLRGWVGDSVERARVVAGIAEPGRDRPTDVGLFLLGVFGDDDVVRGELAGQFQSGSFVGPWSDTLRTQMAQLRGWSADDGLPSGVRNWADALADGLEPRLEEALRREEEGGW